jgi:hypothetical protein
MKKTIFIFVNGILTKPADADNWNGKAVTWTHLHTSHRAEKIEYYVGPISRVLGQTKRSAKLLKTLSYYVSHGWRIALVGHSNGANVICNALKEASKEVHDAIVAIHLIAPASENDFDKNGLNVVDSPVFVYIGTEDRALKFSSGIGRLFGYGSLGKDGPKNVRIEDVQVVKRKFNHSDWFADLNLNDTFKKVTAIA